MLKNKDITSEWTAIWPLSLNMVTFGGSQPQLATLFLSQLLSFSVSYFSLAYFLPKRAFVISIIMCSTPLIGATGITLWHDIPMCAGFLLFVGAIKKIVSPGKSVYFFMILGGVLASYRFNGLPTLIVFVGLILASSRNRKHLFGVLTMLFALSIASAALNTAYKSDLNVQSDGFIDWMRYDISCYASLSTDEVLFASNFEGRFTRKDWSSKSACTWFNDSTAFGIRTDEVNKAIPKVWFELASKQPLFVLKTHADRHKYLIPIPYNGLPDFPFIHTTIEIPNDFINFTHLKASESLRSFPRIWNYLNFIFGYAGLWLFIIFFISWKKRNRDFLNLALLGLTLTLSLFVFAPISDGRFTLPLLITSQMVFLSMCLDWIDLRFMSKKLMLDREI